MGETSTLEMITGYYDNRNLTARSIFDMFLNEVNTKQATLIAAMKRGTSLLSLLPDHAVQQPSFVQINALETGNMPTAMQYYAVSILIMFLLYAGMGLALSFMTDRRNHTFERIMIAPIRPYQYVIG